MALRDRIVLGHPGLLRRTHAVQRGWEEQLALELARLRGLDVPDDATALDAAVGLGVIRLAVRRWRAGRSSSLTEAVVSILSQLDGLVTPVTSGVVRRSSRPG